MIPHGRLECLASIFGYLSALVLGHFLRHLVRRTDCDPAPPPPSLPGPWTGPASPSRFARCEPSAGAGGLGNGLGLRACLGESLARFMPQRRRVYGLERGTLGSTLGLSFSTRLFSPSLAAISPRPVDPLQRSVRTCGRARVAGEIGERHAPVTV